MQAQVIRVAVSSLVPLDLFPQSVTSVSYRCIHGDGFDKFQNLNSSQIVLERVTITQLLEVSKFIPLYSVG